MGAVTLRLSTGGPVPWATAALARARGARQPAVGSLLGLEHEYRVLGAAGVPVDFRLLLPRLAVAGRPLDPGDVHALRLAWGAALTADEREAEIALPPIRARPGAAALVRDLAERARAELEGLLPAGHSMAGYSTHISVAMPTALAGSLAPRYTRTFAPGLMLLLDGPEAPGLLVRPRPGRLELGGDHRAGDGLRAAILFALGSARALAGREGRSSRRAGLPLLGNDPVPTVDRYGWYVDRAAFGGDLYAAGRDAALPLAGGGVIRAGELLARAWELARRSVLDVAPRDDLALVDAIVDGRLPLPIEVAPAAGIERPAVARLERPAAVSRPAFRAPEGAILDDVVRPGFTLRATLATWEFAAFEVRGARRAAVAVPRAELGPFLAAAATGALDRQIDAFLARPSSGALLATRGQATGPARIYDGIADPRGLLAEEPGDRLIGAAGRTVGAAANVARLAGRLGGVDLDSVDIGGDRPGKRRPRDQRDSHPEQPSNAAPQAPAPAPPLPAAAGLPIVPIVAAGAIVITVAVLAIVTGVVGGRPGATPAPAASVAAAGTIAPVASLGASGVPPGTPGEPGSTAALPGLPPPIGEARIAGTYSDGAGDSYHLVVTPSCVVGACDATATILSIPFEQYSPRGAITVAFASAGGVWTGSGSGAIPVCRTAKGRVLTTTQTYTLSAVRATEQEEISGQWVATTIAGTIGLGGASAAGDGTTCTAVASQQAVVLTLIEPEPSPSATPPPLADARIVGAYAAVGSGGGEILTAVPVCPVGACDTTWRFDVSLDPATPAQLQVTLINAQGTYSGSGTALNLPCGNGARVNLTFNWKDVHVIEQQLIGMQWTATRLSATVNTPAFKQLSGPGCRGEDTTSTRELLLQQ